MSVKSIILLLLMIGSAAIGFFDKVLFQVYLFIICLPAVLFALIVDPIRYLWRRIFKQSRLSISSFILDDFIENIFAY
jgi:hypothetical protein